MLTITPLSALENLDSRARPTLAVTVTLSGGTVARAGVPSGASTGTREAVAPSDGDQSRFSGAGVAQAVGHVNGEIADALSGRDFDALAALDAELIAQIKSGAPARGERVAKYNRLVEIAAEDRSLAYGG